MGLIPLSIPPGVYRGGTDLQAAGRWQDASLVRWVGGILQPVGGWSERADLGAVAIRAILAWRDLSGDGRWAAGSPDGLFAVTSANVISDITPSGLTAGETDAAANTGFGGGAFGIGAFGTARDADYEPIEATTWSLDTWGEMLIACSVADGTIYEWDLSDPEAVAVTGAPTDNLGAVVTDERFLVALGAGGNPRRVQWSDREDREVWTPAASNEAGDYDLQTQGQIMAAYRTRGQTLILTTMDAHSMTYQGPPFVYGFSRVGSYCGVIGRKAAASVEPGVIWMGKRGFHLYAGGVVQDVACDVADYVFADINRAQASKIYAVPNSQYGEVWWFYPSVASTENDRYVAYSYRDGHWSIGALARTCGVDAGIFRTPVWVAPEGMAYNHESGLVAAGDSYAETGPIGISDQVMAVTQLLPDEATRGDVVATFKARIWPNGAETEHGPYQMGEPSSVRFTGRQVKMRVTSARAADWRVGVMRINAVARGMR